ncbi:phosphoinositide phospholipase C 2-like isoform X1 [Pistacia vera]|uniref:phosphoinositide phospholipase C 2-like isoform X1 n=1 Tax=Pistacia vera TaxID=55513 RepID=UPI0012633A5B|nr:phosphoinositide phospholipase C 2-like isoform X1 [Pistacia vera]XP_031282665.1 phosphoinositide phospholipase C 2-like isoform X1 [Pistacia vera]
MARPTHAVKFCFFFKRIFRIRAAEPPKEVREIFDKYSSETGTMTIDDLHKFMIDFQGETDATKEHAQEVFNRLKHLNIFHRKGFHLHAFFRYLIGDHNTALRSQVHHNMDSPLAHYFLFTGHNSYLTGNQLSSDSSVDPIIKALKKGVRVIELDLWPNNEKNDIKVCHGGTLTAPVDLIKCLRVIKDNAFIASEYPVVITFEDHLTADLQAEVAKMVTNTFGKMLYYPKYGDHIPSPNELKKKILISTKPPKEYLETQDGKGNLQKSRSASMKEVPQIEKTYSKSLSDDANDKDQAEQVEFIEEEDEDKAALQYRNLIAIHATKLKGGLGSWQGLTQSKVKRLSMSEQQLESAIKTHGKDIIKFTQKNILRIYPKGTRIFSSNYNPFVGWAHGAQMVAFNMQGTGKHLWTMQGMFRANGGCGYVKKPAFLLAPNPEDDLFNPSEPLEPQKTLKVKIYQGVGWHLDFPPTAFDRYSPPDFFIKVSTAGVRPDELKYKTRTVTDDWVPSWNEEFEFPLTVPDLAVLRIQVYDYDTSGKNDFAGQTCLPVAELKSGIRAVPLYNKEGTPYKHTRLLVQFNFENLVS